MRRRSGGLSVVLIPEEGGESRTFRFSSIGLRVVMTLGLILVVGGAVMATSWWYLAFQAGKSWQLQATVDSLQVERGQILRLAEEVERMEAEYERLRALFGPETSPIASDLWLPPTGLPTRGRASEDPAPDSDIPTSWPLTAPGSVTQVYEEGGAGEHPGLDIAIPTDSYVRAAGAGRVLRMGEDPVYGLFVVLEHGGGYQTIYAHASMVLVERGQAVRREEVIALSGSTGRSTAAHLHFEILLNGIRVDPLTMVEQPS